MSEGGLFRSSIVAKFRYMDATGNWCRITIEVTPNASVSNAWELPAANESRAKERMESYKAPDIASVIYLGSEKTTVNGVRALWIDAEFNGTSELSSRITRFYYFIQNQKLFLIYASTNRNKLWFRQKIPMLHETVSSLTIQSH